ncbi:MAG: CDP-glycerol glycerophosphotransferase family protein [Bacteroidota bacterium]|nr:CDP-glycerol glycerophosphotransferase family protein [Bacteroidota bacterium]
MIKSIIIQIALIILSWLVPKKKSLILLGAGSKHDFRGNPKYLFLFINQNKTPFDGRWSAGTKSLYYELKNAGLPVVYRYSIKGLWYILRAKYLIIEKSSKDVYYTDFIFGRFNFLQTWHGITIKKLGVHAIEEKKGAPGQSILARPKIWKFMKKYHLLSMMKYRLILSTTKNQEQLLKDVFLNNRVVTLGYPRNDLFFDKNLLYKNYQDLLKLRRFQKIFLYAPTFRDSKDSVRPFSESFFQKLNAYFKQQNYLFIIKKHPLQANISVPENLPYIKDYSSKVHDLHDLLFHTDVLISDYSSAVNDFILTNRPIIYYNYDLEDYERTCRGFYYDYNRIFPGPFAQSEDELLATVQNIEKIHKQVGIQSGYRKQKDFFYDHADGNSSARFLNYIASSL